MPYRNIDASLSPADAKAVEDAFDTVLEKLPFPVMTPRNGRTHSRPYREIDADSVSFVRNALTAALHPQEDHRPPPRQPQAPRNSRTTWILLPLSPNWASLPRRWPLG